MVSDVVLLVIVGFCLRLKTLDCKERQCVGADDVYTGSDH